MRLTSKALGRTRWLVAGAGLLAAVTAQAQSPCDAWYRFDGDLADSGGNGYSGTMFGPEGAAARASFSEGIAGRALSLDGTAAMRADLDLHPDACPRVTVTAWIRLDAREPGGTGYLFSAGGGSDIGLYHRGRTLTLRGRGNGLSYAGVLRDHRAWFFVAGVYDFAAGNYRLYVRNRTHEGTLRANSREPEDVIFVGARGEGFAYPARQLNVDELRVFGRALSDEELREVASRESSRPWLTAVPHASTRNRQGPATVDLGGNVPRNDPPLGPVTLPGTGPDGSSETVDAGLSGPTTSPGPAASLEPHDDLSPSFAGSDTPDRPLLDAGPAGQYGADPGLELTDEQLPQFDGPIVQDGQSPTPGARPMDYEVYANDASGPLRTVRLVLPGSTVEQTITYEEIDGLAIAEGDIILGRVADLDRWAEAVEPEATGAAGVRRQGLNAIANTDMLWPGGRIAYEISAGLSGTKQANVNAAITAFNAATSPNIQWVQRSTQDDFVRFVQGDDAAACSSSVGRQTGRQDINLSTSNNGCRTSTFLHEMLHAAGVWHEQSRPDRDTYIEVLIDNVQTDPNDRTHNFDKKSLDDGLGVGEYNFESIMHYGPFAFGVSCTPDPPAGSATDPDCRCTFSRGTTTCRARTIRPKATGQRIVRDGSMASDLADILALYPGNPGPQLGLEWGNGNFATAIAVGDVDGDGLGEIIVGRDAGDNSRVLVYDDIPSGNALLDTAGTPWGSDVVVTDVAVGDVDGDGDMEIGVTRRAGSSNRWYIYDYRNNRLEQIHAGGNDWGGGIYATAIAFGDVDNDGRDEIAVGRRAGEFGRYYLYNDAAAPDPYARLAIGGSDWDATHYTTGLAFGDVDNDGRDELGVTRNAASGMRYEIVEYAGGAFTQLHGDGHDWDSTHYGTAIAFGNVDNDPGEEVIVGRRAASGSRFHILDDASGGFALLDRGGDLWGSNYWAVAVDLADIDNNGLDEVIVARNAGEAGRYFFFKDRPRGFEPILVGGEPMRGAPNFSGVGATDIAAGDMDGDGRADVAVSYDQKVTGRMRWEAIGIR